jgi:hypothetical protein
MRKESVMVGKNFKSKINGDLFRVVKEHTENGSEWLVVRHLKTGKISRVEKGWFLNGHMQNLEAVEPPADGS